jgi:hypothetical protein
VPSVGIELNLIDMDETLTRNISNEWVLLFALFGKNLTCLGGLQKQRVYFQGEAETSESYVKDK